MSRQFDDYMSNSYEINGELNSLISPENFTELMRALESRDLIQQQIDSLMHDEDDSGWLNLLQGQEDLIQEYLDGIGEFNNGCLISNIAFLAKKSDIRFGDLEKMLGISAGYISRTAKENSAKRLSIDVVWKIACLFEVDIKELIETDLSVPNKNTELILQFIKKLRRQTEECSIEWQSDGGVVHELNARYTEMGLISEEDEVAIYHPSHLNPIIKWKLADDIFSCSDIDEGRNLVIIPFHSDELPEVKYDFIFVPVTPDNSNPSGALYDWKKAFYTADDPFGKMQEKAAELYESIRDQEFDAKVSPSVKSFIADYLK
jgi:transcriptional regulator with XRE-family HTH domain